jgi:hypothetical protein
MPDDQPRSKGGAIPKTRPDDARGAPPGAGTVLPPHGGRIGNPPFVATDEQRTQVKTLTKVCSHDMIADLLNISVATLKRHFVDELKQGKAQAVAAVGGKLLQKAMAGHPASMIFYLRTQAKWNVRVEHSGLDGGPIRTVDVSSQIGNMTDEQLAVLEPLLGAILTDGGAGIDGGDSLGAGTGEGGTGEA